MNNVNKTLYIPLYGKSFVSKKGILLHDETAEAIWAKEGFPLKGKSKSKWLAYYMGMRAAVFDEWLRSKLAKDPEAIVLHIGCGMDSRVERVGTHNHQWYDIDFPDVIKERRNYFKESKIYHLIPSDVRNRSWIEAIPAHKKALVVMEGVSMYLKPDELIKLLSDLTQHCMSVQILMDCYTERGAKASRYKNPINDVGVTEVYGMDEPKVLEAGTGLAFIKEHNMTPDSMIDQLKGLEKTIFQCLFGGKIARGIYRMFEYKSK